MFKKKLFIGLFVLASGASAQAACKVQPILSISGINKEVVARAQSSLLEGVKAKGYEIVEEGSKADFVLWYGTEAAGVESSYWGSIRLSGGSKNVVVFDQSTKVTSWFEAFSPSIQDTLVEDSLATFPLASTLESFCQN